MRRSLLPSLLVLSLAACRTTPPETIPVAGDAGSLTHLSGEWAGSYQSPASGRSGSIVFTFTPGEDRARGDVVMIPRGGNAPLRPSQHMGPDSSRMSQVLTIEFVRASGDSISGTLAPYVDPDCNCSTTATFRGRIEGDRIRGSFVATQSQGGRTANGTWEVRRR